MNDNVNTDPWRAGPCYIFDIDGTLADCEWRRHYVENKPKNWEKFYEGVDKDPPIHHVVYLCKTLGLGTAILLVTGRPERCRAKTKAWLVKHHLCHVVRELHMRKDGDFRADDIVKAELLAVIRASGWHPRMAFDDRDRVVAMWRANGVPCAQVAEGDF
jgi:hypothetical protein